MMNFEGKFRNFKDEGLDEYYAAMGLPLVGRNLMALIHPDMIISCKDEVWTVKYKTLLSTVESSFKLGEEYKECMFEGRIPKTVTTIEGNQVITIGKGQRGETRRVMEYTSDDEFVLILCHEQTVARRYFKRITE